MLTGLRQWPTNLHLVGLLLLGLGLLTLSCAEQRAPSYRASYAEPAAEREEDSRAAPPPPPAPEQAGLPSTSSVSTSSSVKSLKMTRSRPQSTSSSTGKSGAAEGSPAQAAVEAPAKRSVYYNGYLKVRVTRPQEVLDQAATLARSLGGFVERLSGTSVSLRVPVDSFQTAFDRLASLGDVLEKSVAAEDVTDALTEIGLRLEAARATRERLIALLAKAKNEQEKLELLRQIQRVTEEIDRMDSQVRTLQSLASYSRLTLEVVQREAMAARSAGQDVAELRWIHQLSPFRRDVASQGKRLDLQVPTGLVELGNKRVFVAESADGTVFWASRQQNKPEGSSEFWMEALKTRLAPEFGDATVQQVGAFKVLRLVDRSEKPYIYLVGVRAVDDVLQVIEVYFPDAAHENRYGAEILKSIQGGEA